MTKNWLIAAAVAVAFVAGGITGRRTAPVDTKIVQIESEASKSLLNQVSSMQQTLQQLTKKVEDFTQKKNVVSTRKTIKLPDGTLTTEEHVEDKTETAAHVDTTINTTANLVQDLKLWLSTEMFKTSVRIEERTRLVEPTWALDIQVGYHLPLIWGSDDPSGLNLSPFRGLVGGVMVSKKAGELFGTGIWVGSWANTRLDAGLNLRLTR